MGAEPWDAGVMLETQNINIAACRLYASCGFVLGGFDACLYRGIMPTTREIALFLVPAVLKEPVRRCNQPNTTSNPPSAR